MADQATVRGGPPHVQAQPHTHTHGHQHAHPGDNGAPERRVVGGIAEFGSDVATLAELQAELALQDLKESLRLALVPMVLIAVGLVGLLGAVPVVLLGVSALLAAALSISSAWAMLLTGGVVLAAALAATAFGAMRIGPSFSIFRRSREELRRNLAWIRTVLLYSGRYTPKRVN